MAEGFLEHSSSDCCDNMVLCHPCSKRNKHSEGVIYCADCEEVQCLTCSKEHDNYVVMGHHVTVGIKDWKYSNIFLDLAKISQCEIHSLPYAFYCEYHNRLCCPNCRSQTHRSCCNIKMLSKMEHRLSGKESASVYTKFEKLIEEAKGLSLKSEERESSVKSEIAEIPSIIEDMRRQVLAKFDDFEEKILKEGKRIEGARLKTLRKIQIQTSALGGDIQNTLKSIKRIPKSMTPEQKFIFETKMDEVIEGYVDEMKVQKDLLTVVGDTVSLQFSSKFLDLLEAPPVDLGQIKTSNDPVDSDFFPDPQAFEINVITTKSMRSSEGVHPFYIGMDFLQNDRIVLADYIYKKCVILSLSLKVIGEQNLKYEPQNLLVFGNDELLISGGKQQFIDHFEVNSQNILTYKRRILTLSPCDSMSLIVDNVFVVGIAGQSKPVCKLKNFVNCSDFYQDFDRGNYKLGETKCAYSHRLETLVLTDYMTNTISIINTRTGDNTRVQDKVIKGPRSVVIAKDLSIIVCCEGSRCLVQLSPSGEILSFRKLRISSPHSLCISKDNSKIAVSNNSADDCLLQLFTIV